MLSLATPASAGSWIHDPRNWGITVAPRGSCSMRCSCDTTLAGVASIPLPAAVVSAASGVEFQRPYDSRAASS